MIEISVIEYFGTKIDDPAATEQMVDNATKLLRQVNKLLEEADGDGILLIPDPDTGTLISGSKGGSGDGGFRLPDSATGRPLSAHKQARAVDVYDPKNDLDRWITDRTLSVYGLYREHPDSTMGWCHLQTKAPKSGKRTFYP